jgi:hypothetical protein
VLLPELFSSFGDTLSRRSSLDRPSRGFDRSRRRPAFRERNSRGPSPVLCSYTAWIDWPVDTQGCAPCFHVFLKRSMEAHRA